MELLGAYSDDSDTERIQVAPVQTVPVKVPATRPVQSGTKGPQKKRRKKLDISFLPENIQTALARGDTNRDSDSDDETNIKLKGAMSARKAVTPGAPLLLSMLPKPKNEDVVSYKQEPAIDEEPVYYHKVRAATYSGGGESATAVAEEDVDTVESSTHSTSNSSSVSSSYHSSSTGTSLSQSSVLGLATSQPMPPAQAATAPLSIPLFAPGLPRPAPGPSPAIPSTTTSSIRLPSFSSAPEVKSTIRPSPSCAPAIPAFAGAPAEGGIAHSHSSTSGDRSYNASTHATAYATSSVTAAAGGLGQQSLQQQQQTRKLSAAEQRKKDRDIHLSLLQGDVSALDKDATSFIDVQQPTEWDNEQYLMQQKRQKELQSMFNFSQKGGDNALAQPTKLQNKRHQINSLVFSAAESELELLEARGRQMKTKYETQAKYGW